MKLIMTVGVSASGKTTWAKEQKHCVNINRDDIRFNSVQPGSDWTTYKFTKVNESRVTEIENVIAERAVKFETNIIIFEVEDSASTAQKFADLGVRTSPFSPTLLRMVTHLDVNEEMVDVVVQKVLPAI